MSEWLESELNKIGNIVSGGTPDTSISKFWDGEILFITPFDLSRTKSAFIENSERKISKEGLENSSANLLPIGSIVVSSRAPIGYIAVAKKEFTTNQGCKSIVPNSNYDSLYFYYCLNFYVERIKRLGAGSTFAEISKSDLELIKFPHPKDKTEQCQIAKILSTADAVIEKTQAAIDKYKAIKQGMLHDLFTRGIVTEPTTYIDKTGKVVELCRNQLRPTYEDAPELYKESKLGWFPKEWEVKPLVDIAVIHNGIDYKRNPPGQEIPIYGTGGIMGFTSVSLNNGPAVLTGRKGSINRPIYIEGEFWNVDTIFCLKPKEKTNTKWLYYNILLTDMNKYNEATGVPSIASKTLYKLNFCHYDIEEQNKIIEFITPIENTLQAEESSLLKLKQLKIGLMGDLLSGKKKVIVKEEEMA